MDGNGFIVVPREEEAQKKGFLEDRADNLEFLAREMSYRDERMNLTNREDEVMKVEVCERKVTSAAVEAAARGKKRETFSCLLSRQFLGLE